ncbi:MAG: ABC transporter substrate-binding protein [Candidatus Heimdallarchaeota archaeon]
MRKAKNNTIVMIIILLSLFLIQGINIQRTEAANPGPFFSISILAPNTNPARNQWATLMVEQLPKIGIAVDVFDHTGWSQILLRTWDYSGPYPIPSYSEGGYDIFFTSWSDRLDYDPTGRFNTAGIIPFGDNVYQYSNHEMDWAISNYTHSFITADRIEYAEDIQAHLYEDLPQISIIYPKSLYPMNDDFSGWDGLLWASCQQSMENWEISGQTGFHYAVPAEFQDFHIYNFNSIFDGQWLHQIYNGLIERQPGTRQWGNRLATSYTSVDGLVWNVNINPNAKWADGTTLDAFDVNYSYNLLIDPDFGSPDLAFWQTYIGPESVNVLNPTEVEITFLQHYVFQESNLAVDLLPEHIWGAIDPADHATQAQTWASTDPSKLLGAGPYYLVEYDGTNGVIHLDKNEYFDDWSGITPNFDDVYFEFYSNKEGALSALAAGALDMIDANFSPQLDELNLPGITYQLIEDPSSEEIAINMQHPYLGTGALCPIASAESAKHIRKAISHMIPREIIVEEILGGLGQSGVTAWSPASFGFDNTLPPYEYSLIMALEHMQLAGFYISSIPYPTPTPTNTTNIIPTTIILDIAFVSITCSLILASTITVTVRYKKQRTC